MQEWDLGKVSVGRRQSGPPDVRRTRPKSGPASRRSGPVGNTYSASRRSPAAEPSAVPVRRAKKRRPRRRRRRGALLSSLLLAFCAVLFTGAALGLVRAVADRFSIQEPEGGALEVLGGAVSGPPYTVALDPGHGGIDRGAEAYAIEYEVAEKTADALMALLESDPNYTPVRTRNNGEGMSIADRAAAADQSGADLFLSIHCNSDETYTASGFECYPQTPASRYNAEALRFAGLLASEMLAAGQNLRGENGVRYIYYADDGAGGYSKVIRESSDAGVYEEQTFGVLEKVHCPGVLAEQCFLTSESAVQNWASDEGCVRAAQVYYRAVCAYFGTQPTA